MLKNFLAILLFGFSFASTGCWGCSLTDIGAAVSGTGRLVGGRQEHFVVIYNKCNCPVSNVSVSCSDFSTVEPVDPNVFSQVPGTDRYLVMQGLPLSPNSSVQFAYAWDKLFTFQPTDFKSHC